MRNTTWSSWEPAAERSRGADGVLAGPQDAGRREDVDVGPHHRLLSGGVWIRSRGSAVSRRPRREQWRPAQRSVRVSHPPRPGTVAAGRRLLVDHHLRQRGAPRPCGWRRPRRRRADGPRPRQARQPQDPLGHAIGHEPSKPPARAPRSRPRTRLAAWFPRVNSNSRAHDSWAMEPKHRPAARREQEIPPLGGISHFEWRDPDSNRGHHDFQSCDVVSEV